MTRLLIVESAAHRPSNPLFVSAGESLASQLDLEIAFVDDAQYQATRRLGRTAARVAGRTLQHRYARMLNARVLQATHEWQPDIALVVKGNTVYRETLAALRHRGVLLVNFSTDDPFNKASCSDELRRSIGSYDLYCSPRKSVFTDLRAAGARRVEYLPFAYKPDVHFPEAAQDQSEHEMFAAHVSFIGGSDAVRAATFEALIATLPGLQLKLYGGGWARTARLARFNHGTVLGHQFRVAAGTAAIVVNLVRESNRDGHVMRSFELPACGAFVASVRTADHERWFREGEDIAYFNDTAGLIELINYYLSRPDERERIAKSGAQRVRDGFHTYADRLAALLDMLQ